MKSVEHSHTRSTLCHRILRPFCQIRAIGIGLALLVWALDQFSKWWIISAIDPLYGYYVTPFFNLVLVHNPGIAFGMFASNQVNQLIWIALAGVVGLLIVFYFWQSQRLSEVVAMGLILGGALGNTTDRWRVGAVVDFVDLHLGGWHWPAFNLSDSAICLGVVLILARLFVRPVVARDS